MPPFSLSKSNLRGFSGDLRRTRFRLILLAVLAGFAMNGCRAKQNPDAKQKHEAAVSPVEIPITEPNWGPEEQAARLHVHELIEQLSKTKEDSPNSISALANAYGELGEIFLSYDLPANAVPCFQNASQWDRANFQWPYLEAICHFNLAETSLAVDAMTEAVRRMSKQKEVAIEHHLAAYCLLGEATMRLNQFDDSRSHFDTVLQSDPNSRFALFKRGKLASLNGDSEEALDFYLRVYRLYGEMNSKPPALEQAIAMELRRLGRSQESEKHLQALASNPKEIVIGYSNPLLTGVRSKNRRPSTLLARAEMEANRGRLHSAVNILHDGIRYSPKTPELAYMKGNYLLTLDQFDEAIDVLDRVPNEFKRDTSYRTIRIHALSKKHATRQLALQEATKWTEEHPDSIPARMALALAHFHSNEFSKAKDLYSEIVQSEPKNVEARLGEFLSLCAMKNYELAREKIEDARTDLPENNNVTLHQARFLACVPDASQRRPPISVEAIRQLLATDNSITVWESYICSLAANGEFTTARQLVGQVASQLTIMDETPLKRRLLAIFSSIEKDTPWIEDWPFDNTKFRKEK